MNNVIPLTTNTYNVLIWMLQGLRERQHKGTIVLDIEGRDAQGNTVIQIYGKSDNDAD